MAKIANLASLLQMQPQRDWYAPDTKTPSYDPDSVEAYLSNPIQAQTETGKRVDPLPPPQVTLGDFLRRYLPFMQGR